MEMEDRIRLLFQSVDQGQVDDFLTFLSQDVLFRFGNAPPVQGRTEVGNAVRGFLGSIKALHHDLVEVWMQPSAVTCHGTVTYTRHDATTLTVPFATIFKLSGEEIREYLIYVDICDLYSHA
ncbi:MAG: nuclear transport factor 2 family protein [Acidobacteriota bacterium]